MPILTVADFCTGLRPGCRVMALDVGTKTIGLATNVWGTELITPLRTLKRVKFTRDAQELHREMQNYEVAALIIGDPLQLDGRPGPRTQSVRDFTAEFDRFLGQSGAPTPITRWDERFTTLQADALINHTGSGLPAQRDAIIDALAAQQILQDFIENNRPE